MIRIGIAEDDDNYIAVLREYLNRYTKENGVAFQVRVFHNGEELTFDYRPEYDILFLDIEMPEMDGMTAAKKVREKDSKVIIFFITSMAQYAVEGYRVRARAYLLKPLNYIGLCLELQDAIQVLPHKKEDLLLTNEDGDQVRLREDSIVYIESRNHDLLFHIRDNPAAADLRKTAVSASASQMSSSSGNYHPVASPGGYGSGYNVANQKHPDQARTPNQILRTRATMKEMEEKMTGHGFARCHSSYLVNLAYVSGIQGEAVEIQGEKLPISRSRRKDFLQALSDYVGRN